MNARKGVKGRWGKNKLHLPSDARVKAVEAIYGKEQPPAPFECNVLQKILQTPPQRLAWEIARDNAKNFPGVPTGHHAQYKLFK